MVQHSRLPVFHGQRHRMRIGEQHQAFSQATHAREEFARARQPGHVRTNFAMQRAHVDSQRARPVVDVVPLQSAAASLEKARDLGIGSVQIEPAQQREALGDEVAPDVVVVGLVEQRAVEIEQNRVDGRPVRPEVRREGHVGAYHTGSP